MNPWRILLAAVAVLLGGCQPAPRNLPATDPLPEHLSAWHVLRVDGAALVLEPQLTPYDLNSPLFSDYAHKLRAIEVPRGTAIRYGTEELDFPVGTVITKTFYYPRAARGSASVRKVLLQTESSSLDLRDVRLIETRLLINTPGGWIAAPYVWNEAQTQATLALAGDSFTLDMVTGTGHESFEYMVPDANQCAGCHAVDHHRQIIRPIGVRVRHLNKDFQYGAIRENQQLHWQRLGLLRAAPPRNGWPRNAQWDVPASGSLDARARAYLDINCAHCHSALAAANTSGLMLDIHEVEPQRWGVCKVPVAAGRGAGDDSFDIVPGEPDHSILLHRMQSNEPDVAMPELGRAIVHVEAVALVREWIASLDGNCETLN
jgi:uncharacterized repeat protein (TIGR03806 family)